MKAFIIFSFSLLAFSCGLDTITYLEPPRILNNNYESEDDSNKYLMFETSETKNASVANYVRGFEVYYRIYERKQESSSDYSQIYKYDEDNPSVSVIYLLETKKYKILSLKNISSNERPLIKKHATNRKVKIRLTEYTGEEVGFYIDNAKIGVPIRSNAKDFKKDDITSSDEDVQAAPSSSTEEDEYWYVSMYAATYGNDPSFKPLYSKLEFIGVIKIKKQ
ncbi:MAG: hypothetical protein ACTTKH_06405 [Treponema sp.]